ncbi:acyl-CoA dehydrogenase family protein [Streptomyces sp. NBC_01260]|uniref:acyl-CoA dehydrogenase family protein n=1 Tax=unclassified Streptomyces TaxID=2593676 RepID=UPI002E31BA5F|nr:acyl-CoA dehydrogenase family protein [Streptomyces sp. NBC_01260]
MARPRALGDHRRHALTPGRIHGKEGPTQGNEIEYLFRKIRMFRVLTGTSEIQRNGIAKLLAFSA